MPSPFALLGETPLPPLPARPPGFAPDVPVLGDEVLSRLVFALMQQSPELRQLVSRVVLSSSDSAAEDYWSRQDEDFRARHGASPTPDSIGSLGMFVPDTREVYIRPGRPYGASKIDRPHVAPRHAAEAPTPLMTLVHEFQHAKNAPTEVSQDLEADQASAFQAEQALPPAEHQALMARATAPRPRLGPRPPAAAQPSGAAGEVVILGDDGAEHVFPVGFDPKRAAEIVRGGGTATDDDGGPFLTPIMAAGLGAAKAAPMLTRRANAVAGVAGTVAGGKIPGLGVRAPAAMAATALGQALHGDIKGAALTGGGAVAMSQVPKAAAAMQKATQTAKGFRGVGPLLRGAGWLSRIASKAALPATVATGAVDTFNAIQDSAKRLDDPDLSPAERQALLLALAGGFAQ